MFVIPDSCPRCKVKLEKTDSYLTRYCPNEPKDLCPIDLTIDDFGSGHLLRLIFRADFNHEWYAIFIHTADMSLRVRHRNLDFLGTISCPEDFSYDQEYLESLVKTILVFQ